MERLDSIAMSILQGLMLRYKENGYSDEHAIHEAYRLAELVVAQKASSNSE